MSAAFTIPAAVMERALSAALLEHVGKVDVEALTMCDAMEAGKLLKISPQAFRAMALEHFDFGARRTRWSLKEIRQLVEQRRVKASPK